MDLEELRRNWDAYGRTTPMRAILWQQKPWDEQGFFASGRVEVRQSLQRLRELGIEPEGRALDFGCGMGRLTQALAEEYEEVVGVDVAESMIELARRYNKFPDTCRYLVNSSADLQQFTSESFDFVYSLIVLQHVGADNAKSYIREFMRILRPNGIAMFQLPRAPVVSAPLPTDALHAALRVSDVNGEEDYAARISVQPGSPVRLSVRVRNASQRDWNAAHRIALIGLWLKSPQRTPIEEVGPELGPRELLNTDLLPDEEIKLSVSAVAPSRPGEYLLTLRLHQVGVLTFCDHGVAPVAVKVHVEGDEASTASEGTDSGAQTSETPRMEMHAVPREDVISLITLGGGEVVSIDDDSWGGPDWHSCSYVIRKTRIEETNERVVARQPAELGGSGTSFVAAVARPVLRELRTRVVAWLGARRSPR